MAKAKHPIEIHPAYIQGAFDTFVLAHDFDGDLLCDYGQLREFGRIMQLPQVAVLLADQVRTAGQLLTPDDLDVWLRWPGRKAWTRLVRQALADAAE